MSLQAGNYKYQAGRGAIPIHCIFVETGYGTLLGVLSCLSVYGSVGLLFCGGVFFCC